MNQPFHEIIKHTKLIPAFISPHKPGDATVDQHWHEELELTASLDSQINFECNSHKFVLKENDVVIVNSMDFHRGIPVQGHENYAISLNISPDFLKLYCPNYDLIRFDLSGMIEVRKELSDYMRILFDLCMIDQKEPYHQLKANEIVCHIVYILLSKCQVISPSKQTTSSVKYKQRYRDIMSYMNEHYNEPLTLSDVASYSHISKEHLSRNFKGYVGAGFHEHLVRIRLSKAQSDLLNTDMPLQDIAITHGFPDLKSYNTAFKKIFGESPMQYRKNIRNITEIE